MDLGELYFITDSKLSSNGVLEDCMKAVSAGVKVIQYREKEKSSEAIKEEAEAVQKICGENNVLFVMNDHLELAVSLNADCLHVGQKDIALEEAKENFSGKIGVSVNNLEQALLAEEKGADYLGVGPIFATKTKPDADPATGTQLITEIKNKVNLPLVAIGGINKENMKEVIEAGADSVAMISAVIGREEMERDIKEIIGKARGIKSEMKGKLY